MSVRGQMSELNADRLKDPVRRALSPDNVALGLNSFLAGAVWALPAEEQVARLTTITPSAPESRRDNGKSR